MTYKYKLVPNCPDMIQRLPDQVFIPKGHSLWDEYQEWLDAGNTPIVLETLAELISATDKAIEDWLDDVVKQQNYRSIESCISYVGDEEPRFDAQARAAKSWRSAVYKAAALMMANPPAGVDSPEKAIALLPKPEDFGWYDAPEIGPLSDIKSEATVSGEPESQSG